MESIRERLENPFVVGALGLFVGIILGLIWGWVIDPVEYAGAFPRDLVYEQKVEYMRMALEAYQGNGNAEKAIARYNALEDDAAQALNEVLQDPQDLNPETVASFSAAVGAGAPVEPELPEQPAAEEQPPAEEEPAEERSLFARLLPWLCGIALVGAAVLIYFFIVRSRQVTQSQPTPAMQAQQAAREAERTDYAVTGAEPPVTQFMASYKIGDDLFDDSFSIDSPIGEFLGECGVGISDTIGSADPKKVTAFEVWLFDKNDIQTVTNVVMSAYAFNDPATRQRLEAKGEPVLAEPGGETVLETQTLQMVARVVEMSYGVDGALPEDSFFDQLILELAVWSK
jgi:hypothetical protein